MEFLVSKAKKDKQMEATELIHSLIVDADCKEDKSQLAIEEATKSDLEILLMVEELREMLALAKETNKY